MVCCIVLKPKINSQSLFLNRQKQSLINHRIATYLKYKPFIFNSSRGMYIFAKKNESFEQIESILIQVFTDIDLEKIRIFDTSLSPDFFRSVTKEVLQSEDISAFAWKRFISSFLIQADPYGTKSEPDNIRVFQNFQTSIRNNGNRLQKRFFKRKMKILRKRVSLKSLDDLLKND
jgi:hypothetical protein